MILLIYIVLASGTVGAVDSKLRLIGGTTVEKYEFPSIVSLQYDKSGNKTFRHSCAGSIVDKRFIVTAAHCVWNKTIDKLHVLAGSLNVKIEEDGQLRINVSKMFVHPQYKSQNKAGPYDIAILKLESDLPFSETTNTIELPEYGRTASGECTSLGWGNRFMISQLHYAASEELRKISSYVLNWHLCWAAYGFVLRIPLQTALCTTGGPIRGSCQGDSGGPVVCYKEDKTPYLAGIVSWGWLVCGDGLHPDVSTDVSRLRGFIDSIITLNEEY